MRRFCFFALAFAACSSVPGSGAGGSGGGAGSGGTGGGEGGAGGTGGSGGGAPATEPTALAGITAAHNAVRAGVKVGALTWDGELAKIAQAWAETCTDLEAPAGFVDSNPDRSAGQPQYVGENIYASSGEATPKAALDLWKAEAANYEYATNTCEAGRVCSHYTQVVWRATERVGCGIAICPALTYGSTIVCNYAPGGNDGGKPY